MRVASLAIPALAGLALGAPAVSTAGEWDLSGSLDLQTRLFTADARWPGQESSGLQLSLAGTMELRWRNGDQRLAIIPTGRWDEADDERSLVDLREAYWAYEGDSFEFLVGANTVFWGVAESVHLVDIVNQTDAAADIDGEDKLGQPMLNLALQRDWGLVSLYVLPYFRERTFAGRDGRLRAPLPVDGDAAVYESSAGQNHIDVALRYGHYVGDIDIGLSLFRGSSREPRLLPDATGTSLLPFYDLVTQVGIDLQYTRDAWLWKFEGIVRDGYENTFAAAVGGFEVTRYQVLDSSADVGLLLELQYDGRGRAEPVSLADNDVFVGARLAMNDTQDTALLAGVGVDVDTGETFINIEADRRIGDRYVVELRARLFSGAAEDDVTYALASDDYVQLQLSRYF